MGRRKKDSPDEGEGRDRLAVVPIHFVSTLSLTVLARAAAPTHLMQTGPTGSVRWVLALRDGFCPYRSSSSSQVLCVWWWLLAPGRGVLPRQGRGHQLTGVVVPSHPTLGHPVVRVATPPAGH